MVDHTITASPSFSSRKRQRQRQRQRRRLWLTREEQELSTKTGQHQPLNTGSDDDGKNDDDEDEDDASLSYDLVFDEFSILPPRKSLMFFLGNTIVVGQEFVLTGLFLAGHRAAIYEEERWDEQQQQQKNNYDSNNSNSKSDSNNNNHDPSVILLSEKLIWSLSLVWLTIVISVVTNKFATSKQYRIQHRFTDFALMAMFIRLLASVLRTLTSSFSSDTVYALSILALFIHVLACDYAYANGVVVNSQDGDEDEDDEVGVHVDDEDDKQPDRQSTGTTTALTPIQRRNRKYQRPAFKGGTLSLTTVFFATILLASRLRHNMTVYVFVCSSVVLFALFPAARHLVAVKAASAAACAALQNSDDRNYQSSSSLRARISSFVLQCVPLIITSILSVALMVLLDEKERLGVGTMLTIICGVVPIWKYHLQRYKVLLRGPWDIAHV